jgi:uncharacterized protein YfiM (DUF2279 family)
MTSPDGQLRVNLDQLQNTSANWMQSAAGMRGGAPPPVTTPGWPTGAMTAAIHSGAEHTTESLQAGMNGSAQGLANSADAFQAADKGDSTKMKDITGPLSDILGEATGLSGAFTGAVGSIGGVLSSMISTTLSSALKGAGAGQSQGTQQNPSNYDDGGVDYGRTDFGPG